MATVLISGKCFPADWFTHSTGWENHGDYLLGWATDSEGWLQSVQKFQNGTFRIYA